MVTPVLVLALSIGLLAEPAAAPTFPVDASGSSRDFEKPPSGSPADRALWQKGYDLDNDLVIEQHVASRLANRAKQGQYEERLRDPAKRGALPAEAAEALTSRLVAKWTASIEVMSSDWPVSKIRVCRYEMLNFETVLITDPSPAKDAQLAEARRTLQDCVDRASQVFAALRKANQEFEAVLVEAERAIGPPPPAQAPAAAPATATSKK